MLRKVTLYGELGEKFGADWSLDVSNTHEIAKALEANKPGFSQFIMEREYHVVIGGKGVTKESQLLDHIGSKDVKIIPVVHGSKNGLGMVLIGALIVFAPYMVGLMSTAAPGMLAANASFGSIWASGMGSMFGVSMAGSSMFTTLALKAGMGLLLTGISSMLAPKPSKPQSNEVNNGESYNFNGPVNTISQGLPLPLCYGELIVGGALISASISTEDTDGE